MNPSHLIGTFTPSKKELMHNIHKLNTKNSASITVLSSSIVKKKTFLDYFLFASGMMSAFIVSVNNDDSSVSLGVLVRLDRGESINAVVSINEGGASMDCTGGGETMGVYERTTGKLVKLEGFDSCDIGAIGEVRDKALNSIAEGDGGIVIGY